MEGWTKFIGFPKMLGIQDGPHPYGKNHGFLPGIWVNSLVKNW